MGGGVSENAASKRARDEACARFLAQCEAARREYEARVLPRVPFWRVEVWQWWCPKCGQANYTEEVGERVTCGGCEGQFRRAASKAWLDRWAVEVLEDLWATHLGGGAMLESAEPEPVGDGLLLIRTTGGEEVWVWPQDVLAVHFRPNHYESARVFVDLRGEAKPVVLLGEPDAETRGRLCAARRAGR